MTDMTECFNLLKVQTGVNQTRLDASAGRIAMSVYVCNRHTNIYIYIYTYKKV